MGINTGLEMYATSCSVDEHKQTGAVSSRGGQVSVLVPDCLVLVVVGIVSAIFITHENDMSSYKTCISLSGVLCTPLMVPTNTRTEQSFTITMSYGWYS